MRVQQELDDSAKGQGTVDTWVEFVDDRWEKHLSTIEVFQGEGRIDNLYGFQKREEKEEASSSELLTPAPPLREAAKEKEEEGRVGKGKVEGKEGEASGGLESEDGKCLLPMQFK